MKTTCLPILIWIDSGLSQLKENSTLGVHQYNVPGYSNFLPWPSLPQKTMVIQSMLFYVLALFAQWMFCTPGPCQASGWSTNGKSMPCRSACYTAGVEKNRLLGKRESSPAVKQNVRYNRGNFKTTNCPPPLNCSQLGTGCCSKVAFMQDHVDLALSH